MSQLVEYGEPLSVKAALGAELTLVEQVEWYNAARQASAALSDHLRARTPPLEVELVPGDVRIRVVGAAGHLMLRGLSIEVLPKFAPDESSERWQTALLRMLKLSRSHGFELGSSVRVSEGSMSLLDHLALTYADALLSGRRNGPLLMYQRMQTEGSVLRGRLDVGAQFRTYRPHVISSETDTLEEDNPLTRLLAWAADSLNQSATLLRVKARVREARTTLAGVPPLPPSPQSASRLRVPRASAHYDEAVAIARALVVSKPLTAGGGTTSSYGVLFNTERAFELLVSALLTRAAARLGIEFATRPQRLETLANGSGEARPFEVRPDDQLHRAGTPVATLDAKYKTNRGRGPGRPSEDDFRQALASAIAIRSSSAFLVYPTSASIGSEVFAWEVPLPSGTAVKVTSIGLPLMALVSPSGADTLTGELVNALRAVGAVA